MATGSVCTDLVVEVVEPLAQSGIILLGPIAAKKKEIQSVIQSIIDKYGSLGNALEGFELPVLIQLSVIDYFDAVLNCDAIVCLDPNFQVVADVIDAFESFFGPIDPNAIPQALLDQLQPFVDEFNNRLKGAWEDANNAATSFLLGNALGIIDRLNKILQALVKSSGAEALQNKVTDMVECLNPNLPEPVPLFDQYLAIAEQLEYKPNGDLIVYTDEQQEAMDKYLNDKNDLLALVT